MPIITSGFTTSNIEFIHNQLSASKLPLITIFHISNMENYHHNSKSELSKCHSCGHISRQHSKPKSSTDKPKASGTNKYSNKDKNSNWRVISPNGVRVVSVAPHQFVDDYMVVEVVKNKKKSVKRHANGRKEIKERERPIRYHRFETETIMAYSDASNQYQLPNFVEKNEVRAKLVSTRNEPLDTTNQEESLIYQYQDFRQQTQKTQSRTAQSQGSPQSSRRQIGKFTKPRSSRSKPKNIFEEGLSSIHLELANDLTNINNTSINSKQCIQLSYSCSNMDNECLVTEKESLNALMMKQDQKSVSEAEELLLSSPSSIIGETETNRVHHRFLGQEYFNKENYMRNPHDCNI